MGNYLQALRGIIIKSKTVDEVKDILDIEFINHNLIANNPNQFIVNDEGLIYFCPPNDGKKFHNFEFIKDNQAIIDNKRSFLEIVNLDDILIQMVKLYEVAFDNKIVLDPYYFMLKLEDPIVPNYKGRATLIATIESFKNPLLNYQSFKEANKYFMNCFLDCFMGWNFGISIERNRQLKDELLYLNYKVIDKGLRKYIGYGYMVNFNDDVQEYELPINNVGNSKIKRIV